MPDGFSLIKIDGKIVEPATELIQKIAAAIGGGFKPRHIRHVAEAQADAAIIKTRANIKISELNQRALTRFVMEESKKQSNIESITQKAIVDLNTSAHPHDIEDDWITNFFDKCRIISDEEMQVLWGKILAGESNSPGTYSKRTINSLGSFDKTDAQLFAKVCSYHLRINNNIVLFIDSRDLNADESIYHKNGLDFEAILHLSSIGLITFESAGYRQTDFNKQIEIFCNRTKLRLEFKQPKANEFSHGNAVLTIMGKELAEVCHFEQIDEFMDYVISKFILQEIIVSSLYPRQEYK